VRRTVGERDRSINGMTQHYFLQSIASFSFNRLRPPGIPDAVSKREDFPLWKAVLGVIGERDGWMDRLSFLTHERRHCFLVSLDLLPYRSILDRLRLLVVPFAVYKSEDFPLWKAVRGMAGERDLSIDGSHWFLVSLLPLSIDCVLHSSPTQHPRGKISLFGRLCRGWPENAIDRCWIVF